MLAAGFYRKEGRYTFHAIWGVIKIPGAQMTMANCSLLVIPRKGPSHQPTCRGMVGGSRHKRGLIRLMRVTGIA